MQLDRHQSHGNSNLAPLVQVFNLPGCHLRRFDYMSSTINKVELNKIELEMANWGGGDGVWKRIPKQQFYSLVNLKVNLNRSVSLPPPHFELGVQNRLNQLCWSLSPVYCGGLRRRQPPLRISGSKQRA